MNIELINLSPDYIPRRDLIGSEVFLQDCVAIHSGERIAIQARSGRGKSTVLNLIYGTHNLCSGEVRFHGMEGTRFELRRRHLSYVFQDLRLFLELSALENLKLNNALTNFKSEQEMKSLIEASGLGEKMHAATGTLSFGQRQRVAIIRALCQPFRWLMLDEPFSHLDDANSKVMASLIDSEVSNQGAGLIVSVLDDRGHLTFDRTLKL